MAQTPEDNFVSDIFSSRFAYHDGYGQDYLEWIILSAEVVLIRAFREVIPDFPDAILKTLRPQCVNDYVCYETTMAVCKDVGLDLNYCEGVLFKRSAERYPPEPHAWISYKGHYVDIARELGGHICDHDIYFLTIELPCNVALSMDQQSGFLAYPHWKSTRGLTPIRT